MFNGESAYDSLLDDCVKSAMASCRNMSSEQIEQILNSESKLDSIIQSIPQVRSMPSEREVGLTENKTLAEWNIAQEPRIDRLREQIRQTYDSATVLRGEVETLKSKLDGDIGSRSLDVTSNLLQVAAQEVDDDAEVMASDFYSGTIPADVFLKSFHDKKTLAHMRKIKSDRLISFLREQQYAQPQPAPRMSVPPGGFPGYPNAQAGSRHSFF